jgi:hypothetical protein
MARDELVASYLNGHISRRTFVRRLVAAGVSLTAALTYAQMRPDLARAQTGPGGGYYGHYGHYGHYGDNGHYGHDCHYGEPTLHRGQFGPPPELPSGPPIGDPPVGPPIGGMPPGIPGIPGVPGSGPLTGTGSSSTGAGAGKVGGAGKKSALPKFKNRRHKKHHSKRHGL